MMKILSNVNLSPKDEIRQEESNLREEAISDHKFKLHDNSHILTETNLPNENNENLNSQEKINPSEDNIDVKILVLRKDQDFK